MIDFFLVSYICVHLRMLKKILTDPKIAGAVIAGYLLPKVAGYVGQMIWQSLEKRHAEKGTYVGIELGGTNYNIGFGHPEFNREGKIVSFSLRKQTSGRTTENAEQTLDEIINYIKSALQEDEKCYFIGIASFGPLELDQKQENYGSITSTPKPGWKNMNVYSYLKNNLQPEHISIQTDVNAAAFAQFEQGGHGVQESLAYVTVGTGVGVGVVSHGKTVHGLTHPEGGHIIVNRHPDEYEGFEGVCPFHNNCLQGMVSNKAIAKRLNKDFTKLHELDDGERIWEIIGFYLAQLCINLTLTVSPQAIIIGGGVMNRKVILKFVHKYFLEMLNRYIEHPLFTKDNISHYIKPPALGTNVGLKGALSSKFM